MQVDSFPDRTIMLNGESYLYFGGTSYLGLATNQAFKDVLKQNIDEWGTFYGSSRQSNIKLRVFDKVEAFFAKQIGSEATLTTSSGTLAGRLVLDFLSKTKANFYHYPKTHPAILAPYSKPIFIDNKLHADLLTNKKEEIVVTLDAILALEVEPTSLNFIKEINKNKNITLVIDESHSLGILGVSGNGIFKTITFENIQRKVMIASLGKALGLHGGIIASDRQFINDLKEETLFISSSCSNASYLETYFQTEKIVAKQKQILKNNLKYFAKVFNRTDTFQYNENYPVIYSADQNLYQELLNNKIIISSFKYPNYEDAMNRIVITANHTFEDIEKLARALSSCSFR